MDETTKKQIQQRATIEPERPAVFLHERLRPAPGFLLLKVHHDGRSRGGIIIPEIAQTKSQAEVIAVGPGRYSEGVQVPVFCKVGDHVWLIPSKKAAEDGKYNGIRIPSEDTSALYVLVHESEVIAVEEQPPKIAIPEMPAIETVSG